MLNVPYISKPDIDRLMEDEIAKSQVLSNAIGSGFSIEDFLESHLRCDLDIDATLPADVMGEVAFQIGKKTRVQINADLTADTESDATDWKLGRWRMTVAHECAHVILHGPLFLTEGAQKPLWNEEIAQVHRCYKKQDKKFDQTDFAREEHDFNQRYGWDSGTLINDSKARQNMEVQANCGGAALLMPASLFQESARILCEKVMQSSSPHFGREDKIEMVVSRLSFQFVVSKTAARIRCKDLNIERFLVNTSLPF